LPIDKARVVYTPWLNVNFPVEYVLGGRERVAQKGFIQSGRNRGVVRGLGQIYKAMIHIPDGQIGWLRYAIRRGRKILGRQHFDLIYASAPPFSGLMVARKLAQEFRLPWIAELRDLWSNNHNYPFPRWRRMIDNMLEQRALATASMIVTVSGALAEKLRDKYSVPVVVSMNGFDPEDLPEQFPHPSNSPVLRAVYTGNVYSDNYDLISLFIGIRKFCDAGGKIELNFYGRNLGDAQTKANELGVASVCNFYPPVTHREAVALQCGSDILLFFCWKGESQAGVLTSKVFEYLGARRPILGVGDIQSESAQFIYNRLSGIVASDSNSIFEALTKWAETKRAQGFIPQNPAGVANGLTRVEQFAPILSTWSAISRD
jgi:hypothetical protein